MTEKHESSGLKKAMNKASDAMGGAAGKASAAMAVSADKFTENAAIGDLYEIAAARIALSRASSDGVRTAARRMIADHTTSTHHLQAALQMNGTRGVEPPPPGMDGRREAMIKHLEEASDEDFDATYLDQQVLVHEETVTLMQTYRDRGENAQLRSFAEGTAPVVERHLEHMKALRASH